MSNLPLSDEGIWIVTASEPISGSKSAHPYHAQVLASQAVRVSAIALQRNMSRFIQLVGGIFQQAEAAAGMQLDKVKLSVELAADGEVKLMGSGAGLEGKGAIELTFTRKQ